MNGTRYKACRITHFNYVAFRALNQAIGRCIRHKYDWGSILFLDERFQSSQSTEKLSKWLRGNIKTFPNFSETLKNLEEFTKKMKSDPPKIPGTFLLLFFFLVYWTRGLHFWTRKEEISKFHLKTSRKETNSYWSNSSGLF